MNQVSVCLIGSYNSYSD